MKWWYIAGIVAALAFAGCDSTQPAEAGQHWVLAGVDRSVKQPSAYPLAADISKVGSFGPKTKSGAGYFYDDVLEYRVWLHPDNGAENKNGTNDYFLAFAQYEAADAYSKSHQGAEPPIVLVLQKEWLDEPQPGKYVRYTEDRITEWQVKWLAGHKRTPGSIDEFLKHPHPAPRDDD